MTIQGASTAIQIFKKNPPSDSKMLQYIVENSRTIIKNSPSHTRDKFASNPNVFFCEDLGRYRFKFCQERADEKYERLNGFAVANGHSRLKPMTDECLAQFIPGSYICPSAEPYDDMLIFLGLEPKGVWLTWSEMFEIFGLETKVPADPTRFFHGVQLVDTPENRQLFHNMMLIHEKFFPPVESSVNPDGSRSIRMTISQRFDMFSNPDFTPPRYESSEATVIDKKITFSRVARQAIAQRYSNFLAYQNTNFLDNL